MGEESDNPVQAHTPRLAPRVCLACLLTALTLLSPSMILSKEFGEFLYHSGLWGGYAYGCWIFGIPVLLAVLALYFWLLVGSCLWQRFRQRRRPAAGRRFT